MRPRIWIVSLCVSGFAFALGCTNGAICRWANANNVAVTVSNGEGQSYDVCKDVIYQTQAVGSGGGPPAGFCDPSTPVSLDTDCSKCMKSTCCAELTACAEDAACICHAGVNTGAACTDPAPSSYAALSTCYAVGCPTCARLP